MSPFQGLGVALITPFDNTGAIDYKALASLIDYQINGGVDYIVTLGTTAETPTLTPEERHSVARFVLNHVGGRVPVVVGCGGNCTRAVLYDLLHDDLSGFAGILSVTPFYNKPNQEGLYRHFAAIAESSPLPVILYNIPSRAGVNMLPDTTLRLANDYPSKIVAVKEASGIMGQMARVIAGAPEGFSVIAGDDSLTLPLITIGGHGVISVAANAFPAQMHLLVESALRGDMEESRRIHRSLADMFRLLFVDGNPAGIKATLAQMGMILNQLRLPLVEVTKQTDEAIAAALKGILQPMR